MHAYDPPTTVVIAALPATPIGTAKKVPPRRWKGEKANVNGSSSSEPPKDNDPSSSKRRASTSSDPENVRRQSTDEGAAEVRDNGSRTRRSIGTREGGVAAATGASAAPLPEERAGDGGGQKDGAGAGGRRKRRRQSRNKDPGAAPVDEKTRISRRVKTMVNRIRLEQNLLDAYAGEGWKGNAREKIRPEKELQRAEMQILRCKLAIRDLIHELDTLALEGSLQKSAFDDEGQIFHEEIFCAKCKSQETFTDNDIILCDGACDRGFHQDCVDPPLATADIPPGDEGWLCPVCESKVECLNYINDFLGTDYQVEDAWEKVFASAAAASERASNPSLGEDWPSEDSDDDDYDPARKPIQDGDAHKENGGERSTLEKAFSELNSLDGSDSEPEASSGSGSGSASGSSSSDDDSGSSECSGDELENPGPQSERRPRRGERNAGNGSGGPTDPVDLSSAMPTDAIAAAELEPVVPVSGKRNRNPVDYKRLHKEMFGEQDDDSLSEDEEWGPARPGGRRVGGKPADGSNGVVKRAPVPRPAPGDEPHGAQSTSAAAAGQQADLSNDRNQFENGKAKKMPVSATKTLREEFDSGNRFPTRAYKEDLAQKLGIGFKQVNSWFKTARHTANRLEREPRNSHDAGAASNGNWIDRGGVGEMEMTNGLLVEKLDEVQLKLLYLKQTLEAMVANRDAGSQPNGKHILYVPVAEVVEKDVEMTVENGKV